MATLQEIDYAIRRVVGERLYDPVDVLLRINTAVSRIAAGIKLPDGRVSPPLPDLFSIDTVATSVGSAVASLPSEYQRNVILISDANDYKVSPPFEGDYYSFNMFTRRACKKDLSEQGSVYMAVVKGTSLYYQGIPASSVDLTVYFCRKPVEMTIANLATDTPDGIPEPFQLNLVKNLVVANILSDNLTNKEVHNVKKAQMEHMNEFYSALDEMMQFVGEQEGEPVYYHSDY